MARRKLHALSASAVAKARDPGYYADGGGLYLQVAPGGAKTWIFRYSRRTGAGKATRPEMGLGGLHSLTLGGARDKAAICRGQLADGIDPLVAREAGEPPHRVESARIPALSRTGRHSTLPQPAAAKPVRAVLRAIDVLQCLNRQPMSTLDLLHKQTALPKPTLVRLLQTLVAKGLVNHAPQSGAYYLTSVVHSLSSGYHSEPRVIEAAAPVADAITAQLKWPVAVAVFDTDAVVVRYSTIAQSPLSPLHSSLNMRLSPVSRALWRAHLAFCPEDEQDIILDLLERSANPEDKAAGSREAVKAMLREHGNTVMRYATRR